MLPALSRPPWVPGPALIVAGPEPAARLPPGSLPLAPEVGLGKEEGFMMMKLTASLALALLMLGIAVQGAVAAELRSSDPTAAVTVFDIGHRIDDNGVRGK